MSSLEKQKILVKAIFKACGGPTELQKTTGIQRQNFTNWQIRGKVPLLIAVDISEQLDIPKWGLNYDDFCKVVGTDIAPSWEEVVKSYFLPKGITDKLLIKEKKWKKEDSKKRKKLHKNKQIK